jgi:hypothetical protein
MRADPKQALVSERIHPRPKDAPKGPRTRSAPVAQIADVPPEVAPSPSTTEPILLLPEEAASRFRSRWEIIQSGFVDDPRHAVEQASALVNEALGQLTSVFEEKREHLQHNSEMPTEELRQTLRHYRLLLNRLF